MVLKTMCIPSIIQIDEEQADCVLEIFTRVFVSFVLLFAILLFFQVCTINAAGQVAAGARGG